MSNASDSGSSQGWRAALRRRNGRRSDALHPWRYVTGALGSSRVAGYARRTISRLLYDYLARRYPQGEWTTMNYGYAALPTATLVPAVAVDAPERFALQLYWYVATSSFQGGTFADLEVLEVGSGRGGGAAFLVRCMQPKALLALDVSSVATALARERYHQESRLEFRQGDAEYLPCETARFDVVLNIESAHCYGSIPRFLAEAHRVLRPGGELLFADFVSRRHKALERLQEALAQGPLQLMHIEDITPNVLHALALDEERKRAMLDRWVTGPFKTFAWGAYAMEGSAMRRELASGQTVYLAAVLRKDDAGRNA